MIHRHRKSIRIKGFDYSSNGYYFVTICTKDKAPLFGKIVNERMVANELGVIISEEWFRTSTIRNNVTLDAFCLMPNHIHGIIIIGEPSNIVHSVGAYCNTPLHLYGIFPDKDFSSPSNCLSSIIRGFKSSTTKKVNFLRSMFETSLWQRNYFERIIRNEKELENIQNYIGNNPLNWPNDPEYTR